MATANADTQWAVASVLFVTFYFVFHLRSVFLAVMGVLLIVFSFPLTALINIGIVGNIFYSVLHNIAIFIVLGVAADDIFVFIDGWRQSARNKYIGHDKRRRLPYAFRRAARATATTSTTTSAAFMANAFNPMIPMASFGIYAAILIMVTYTLIILLFPPIIIWYEDNLAHRCKRTNNEVETLQADEKPETGRIEHFFSTSVNSFVKRFRLIIITISVIWTVSAVYMAS